MVNLMKIKTFLKSGLSAFVLAAGFSGTADAALVSRLGGTAVYDDVANLTWISDANLFKAQAAANPNLVSQILAAVPSVNDTPNIYDTPANSGTHTLTAAEFNTANGRMTWFAAQAWADYLSFGGYSDWRVPTGQAGCNAGFTCTNSEMASWFAALGGVPNSYLMDTPSFPGSTTIVPGTHNAYYALLSNVELYGYWTATEQTGFPRGAYSYSTHGYQASGDKTLQISTLLVRTGDVSAVPLPSAVWLFGSALAGLGVIGRRKATN